MSLLMDALKQAEHAKRDKPTETEAATPPSAPTPQRTEPARTELSLALDESPSPAPADAAAQEAAPDAPAPIAAGATAALSADAVIAATARTETPAQTTATGSAGAQAAARILAVNAARQAAQRRRTGFGLASLGLVLSLALGGYYYYAALAQTQPFMSLPPLAQTTVPESSETGAATAPLQAGMTPAVQLAIGTPPPAQTPWREGALPTLDETAQDWTPAPIDPLVLLKEQHDIPVAEPPITQTPAPVIRISRSTRPDRVNSALLAAYEDFRAGRWAPAEQGYRDALAREPGNRDAHLGLAALALRAADPDTARAHYRELLRRNPKDAAAYAALTELAATRSADSESELKLRLAEQPQSAQLHFSLANVYAAQQRWPRAQQAYFEAQRLAPDNPDYAFNLAVSLEHLGRTRPALDYYRRALQLAQQQTALFDGDIARQRVSLLAAAPAP